MRIAFSHTLMSSYPHLPPRIYKNTPSVSPTHLLFQDHRGHLWSDVAPLESLSDHNMVSQGIQIMGFSLALIGWFLVIIVCALPMWSVTAFIGANIVTAQTIWEGMWMTCVVQSTGQMQCKVYDSMLALSQDLQAARALTIISILVAILAVLIGIAGAKCTNCIEDEASKAKVMIVSGVFFMVAGLMQLIPVSWSANTIIRDFYNPLVTDAQRRELGAALYIGWAAAAMLVLGGALLCCTCPPAETRYNPSRMAYSAPHSAPPLGFERKDYV